MPSLDERREVAARLRDARVKLESVPVPKSIGEQSFTYLLELTKAIGKHDGALFDRFADLIEPEPERTCRVEYAKHGPLFDVLRFSCCGYEWAENRTDPGATEPDPNYCPNCGAKVVSECE